MAKRSALDGIAGARFHLIGVGGTGMSGLAALLQSLGADVSGSDLNPFEGMGALVAGGAKITIGHRAEQVDPGAAAVIVSAAVKQDNPELTAAVELGLPVYKYAELVGRLMKRHPCGVAIAGTHGKSTTTAMCAHICREAGLSPSFLFGARCDELGGGSGVGDGGMFIVEACEYDRSFHQFHPQLGAILNIEPDHLDCYGDLDTLTASFAQFAAQVAQDGVVLVGGEDLRCDEAGRRAPARVERFGFGDGMDWQADELQDDRGCFAFTVRRGGRRLFSTRLAIPGKHNVANALAAAALAYNAGAATDDIGKALSTFQGIRRRLTWRGRARGVTIVDDYAHHPTEIRATIEAARRRYRPRRTWVIFQPHQHARTCYLMDGFADSFDGAHEVLVADVYGARENGNGGGTPRLDGAKELAWRIRDRGGRALYLSGFSALADHILQNMDDGDLVLTMGAGDIWKVADELVERICGPNRS